MKLKKFSGTLYKFLSVLFVLVLLQTLGVFSPFFGIAALVLILMGIYQISRNLK